MSAPSDVLTTCPPYHTQVVALMLRSNALARPAAAAAGAQGQPASAGASAACVQGHEQVSSKLQADTCTSSLDITVPSCNQQTSPECRTTRPAVNQCVCFTCPFVLQLGHAGSSTGQVMMSPTDALPVSGDGQPLPRPEHEIDYPAVLNKVCVWVYRQGHLHRVLCTR